MESIVSGVIAEVFPIVEYSNERGDYHRQEFVLVTHGEYKQPILFVSHVPRRKPLPDLEIGEDVIITFWAKSKKSNTGKYYTSLQVVKIEPMTITEESIKY
jgi:hypothetical protein